MKLPCAFLVVLCVAAFASGQLRNNRDTELSCGNFYQGRATRACDLQETTIGPSGMLDIEPGRNGGVVVKGWDQNNVVVRARLEAWAGNDAEARALLSQVRVEAGGGRIRAVGPDLDQDRRWDEQRYWAVSFEVFTPWNTNLKLSAHNGGVSVSDVRGRIELESHNGGVKLTRVAGDITGSTHNGGIEAELAGNAFEGRQLELSTHNGGVTLSVPASFSASIETRTERGRIDSDFPIVTRGRIDESNLNFSIGSGGPLIKLSTHNGRIRLRRM